MHRDLQVAMKGTRTVAFRTSILLMVFLTVFFQRTHLYSQQVNVDVRGDKATQYFFSLDAVWNYGGTEMMDTAWNDDVIKWNYTVESSETMGINNERDGTIHVCMTSDNNQLVGMLALINSIVQNTQHAVMFHLIVDPPSYNHLRDWIEGSKLRNISYDLKTIPSEWTAGITNNRQKDRMDLRNNSLNYARFFLPELFPNVTGRIVYLDVDIVVQGDISELYTVHFKPGQLAAFAGNIFLYSDYFDFTSDIVKQFGFHPSDVAINAGVMVTHLGLWRKYNITSHLLHWARLNRQKKYYGFGPLMGGSQPPMMIEFYQRFRLIPKEWRLNRSDRSFRNNYSKLSQKAKLIHWKGISKPWNSIVVPFRDIWQRYFVRDPTGQYQLLYTIKAKVVRSSRT